ncbi:hypothetical protein [Tropicibacter oceani]|uniref:DUF2946 domain-containing protein n=1 Tax=Tropicibacter oceani TaxID=3058420 RepID=A0ABY8QI44_9RHOB|nr:hypothetical protein [Tropicibacter oceani]WGW03676.1 hypothetical protein QF118_17425 [Tropicibacter oceani]
MINASRRWVGLALAVLMALTSVQVAVARGASPAVGTMVICLGQTVVTVAVDSDGQPTKGTTHLCPDVALSLFVAEGGGFVPASPVPSWVRLPRDIAAFRGVGRDAPTALARGPPLPV